MTPLQPPLVAGATPTGDTDPWTGVWIAEDIETLLAGITNDLDLAQLNNGSAERCTARTALSSSSFTPFGTTIRITRGAERGPR